MKSQGSKNIKIFQTAFFLCAFLTASSGFCEDPWVKLRKLIKVDENMASLEKENRAAPDPWKKLRAIYLPFSETQEAMAFEAPETGREVSGYFHQSLKPFDALIDEASGRFNIPRQILAGLIMVESSGNPRAKAKTSSAKGLMQTISSTFEQSRNALSSEGIFIKNDPFDPKASIMAGSWYLNQMYEQAKADQKPGVGNRQNLASWKFPLQYYYAGPGGGKKTGDTVIIYAGGRKVVVNKQEYSQKVMRWAKIMEKYG